MTSSRFCIKIDILAQVSSLAPVGDAASWCNQLPAEKFGHSKESRSALSGDRDVKSLWWLLGVHGDRCFLSAECLLCGPSFLPE